MTFDAPPFDAVLLDAPCSATGTIRRHPDVAWTKRPGDIASLAKLQGELLDRAVALTKPRRPASSIAPARWSPKRAKTRSRRCCAAIPTCAAPPIAASEIGGLAECVTPLGDVRTLPCHLPAPTPRQSGLDGFFVARLQRQG